MKIATYNIRTADEGKSIEAIRKEITDLGIQIIGFQEVDNLAKRSGGINVLTEICEEDFSCCQYGAAMEFNGGHYGIGIASVYPMGLVKTVHYKTADYEPRILMICKVDIDGKTVYVANTHLSYEDLEIRKEQFNFLAQELASYSPVILFGDFNVSSFEEFDAVNLNKVNSKENPIPSFKGEIPFRCIDNILYSDDIELITSELNESESSDHNLIWAEIKLK